jgi:hypothetical protein
MNREEAMNVMTYDPVESVDADGNQVPAYLVAILTGLKPGKVVLTSDYLALRLAYNQLSKENERLEEELKAKGVKGRVVLTSDHLMLEKENGELKRQLAKCHKRLAREKKEFLMVG